MKSTWITRWTLTVLGLLVWQADKNPVAAEPTTPVKVTLRTYSTVDGGPTSVIGTSSSNLGSGEAAILFAVVGQFAKYDGACSRMFSGGDPKRADVTERIRNEFASALGGDGYFWDVRVEVDEITLREASLGVTSVRTGGLDGRREVTETRQEVTLPLGARRIVETAPFEVPIGHETCRDATYQLEVEVTPEPHPSMAETDLVYELWFAFTRDGRREEFAATEILAGQSEEIPFRVPALRQVLPGIHSTDGDEITLKAQSRGTIRAWSTGAETVAIKINPSLHHSVASPVGLAFGSGQGSKLYEARLGETVELELPEVGARITTLPNGVTLTDPPLGWAELVDSGLRLDFGRLLYGARYSLLVRVRAEE